MFLCTRCVHAFTCAGIIPSQFINFSCFSGIGTVGKSYIRSGILLVSSPDLLASFSLQVGLGTRLVYYIINHKSNDCLDLVYYHNDI